VGAKTGFPCPFCVHYAAVNGEAVESNFWHNILSVYVAVELSFPGRMCYNGFAG
jgi:hypothetical protein